MSPNLSMSLGGFTAYPDGGAITLAVAT
jgi:hypothetical protein